MSRIEKVKTNKGTLLKIYAVNDESSEKNLVCTIDKKKKKIQYYFQNARYRIKKIELHGYDGIPNEFKWNGHYTRQVLRLFNEKFKKESVSSFIISKNSKTKFKKIGERIDVILNINDLTSFITKLQNLVTENGREKKLMTDSFFSKLDKTTFKPDNKYLKLKAKKIIENVDNDVIQSLDATQREKFSTLVLNNFSGNTNSIPQTKLKIDTITIKTIIDEFEKLMRTGALESKWGKFLADNLYLVNSKYIRTVPEINVILGGSRKVDFGLIDFQGYLDIFEIKLPRTELLMKKTDHGNYYWHTNTVKAIVQIEKYLFNAEQRSIFLKDDLKRYKGNILKDIDLKIIKPKAILLIGHSKQLDNDEKRTDFRILRSSLKNIEIVLYDELLEQLKNQLKKSK